MKPFEPFTSLMARMPSANIDTDQIYPSRFLTTSSKENLDKLLFHDLRYDEDGLPKPAFVLNQPAGRSAKILLVGDNFGCGSSREHAPWALVQFGIRAVISTSFADIFTANALKNSLLPVAVTPAEHARLSELALEERVTIDLADQTLRWGDRNLIAFPLDGFRKACLLEGVDELEWILRRSQAIDDFETRRDHAPA
jgi:3-isopropylmalate/(R)-2-methylmalate dehydratase small subunit